MMKINYFLCSLLLIVSSSAFSNTNILECSYLTYADSNGLHQTDTPLSLRYLIDSTYDSAFVLGKEGNTEVTKINGGQHVTFIESTSLGDVLVTTVTDDLLSTHSRNEVGKDGELLSSLYFGQCRSK